MLSFFSVLFSMVQAKESESPCDKLKPVQILNVEEQKKVDAAFNLAILGWGKGGGDAVTEAGSKTEIQVLASDDLARAWFIYQVCVQREAGIIDDQTATELVRKLMGLSPTGPVPMPTPVPSRSAITPVAVPTMPAGQGEIAVACVYPEAELLVDGNSRGPIMPEGTRLYLPMGYHTVKVKAKGRKSYTKTVQIKTGTTEIINVTTMEKQHIILWVVLGVLIVVVIGVIAVSAGGGGGSGGDDTGIIIDTGF